MEVFVGTSGFSYPWNPNGLEWYIQNSGLNSLELNSPFYRFPFPAYIKSWTNKTETLNSDFRWSVKVNRLITHIYKFSTQASSTWKKFEKLFEPLAPYTDFYLFQLHPKITPDSADKLEKFIAKTNLDEKFALEVRNIEWFKPEWLKWAKKLGITFVSVDSPKFPLDVYNTSGIVYERMHGRSAWYSHDYTNEELKDVTKKILKTKPKKVYIFFNNDFAMLENSRRMLELLRKLK